MDPSDFVHMYEFLIQPRERFLDKFRELGWDEVAVDRGATWNSMLGIFVHLLDVEESWLHYPEKPWPEPSPDLEKHVKRGADGTWDVNPLSFRTLEAVETYHRNVAERTSDLLGNMTRKALDQEFILEGNPELKAAMKHILMHSFVDEMAHLGELDCLLWQMDVDPDWLSWLDVHQTIESLG